MANFNLPVVTDWVINVQTASAAPGPGESTFTFSVELFVNSPPQREHLAVNSVEELSAIVGVLQIPRGRMFFNPANRTLIKTLV